MKYEIYVVNIYDDKCQYLIWNICGEYIYMINIYDESIYGESLYMFQVPGPPPPPPHGHGSPLPPVDVGVGWMNICI